MVSQCEFLCISCVCTKMSPQWSEHSLTYIISTSILRHDFRHLKTLSRAAQCSSVCRNGSRKPKTRACRYYIDVATILNVTRYVRMTASGCCDGGHLAYIYILPRICYMVYRIMCMMPLRCGGRGASMRTTLTGSSPWVVHTYNTAESIFYTTHD